MSTELTTTTGSALAIDPGQTKFSEEQRAALVQIGVEEASDGDLAVFFHVCKRSGLDPFARQIHMVGRRERQPDGSHRMKYTIQTGIDGYRLIGHRAADRGDVTVSVDAPLWAHPEGGWRDVWSPEWGKPIAAKVTIWRDGKSFPGVAMFSEYAQTKRNGELNQMWSQRPAGQLAKCAEALAWRMAFPQDLAGIYADEEMGRADSEGGAGGRPPRRRRSLSDAMNDTTPTPEPETPPAASDDTPAEAEIMLDKDSEIARQLYQALTDHGIDKAGAATLFTDITGRPVKNSSELTETEALRVQEHLDAEPVGGNA